MLYKKFFKNVNFNDRSIQNINKTIKSFSKSYLYLLDTRKDKEEGKNRLGKNKNDYININVKKFNKLMLIFLQHKGFSSKNFTLGVYFSYNCCLNVNFKNKEILLMHPHNWDELLLFIKDFKNEKFIITVRDQRAAYYSSIYNLSTFNPKQFYNLSHHFVTLYILLNFNRIIKKFNLNHFCIRLEDLPHKKTLKLFTKKIKIKYLNSLTTSTFAGKLWNGDEKQKKIYKTTWSVNRTYNGWKTKLTENDKFLINFIMSPILKNLIYDKINRSVFDHLKFLIVVSLPMKFESQILKKNLKKILLKKNKKNNLMKLLLNFFYYLRRVALFIKHYFINIIFGNFNKTKFLKVNLR